LQQFLDVLSQQIEFHVEQITDFFRAETRIPGPDDAPRTNYEAKYRAEGREIYEVRFWTGKFEVRGSKEE